MKYKKLRNDENRSLMEREKREKALIGGREKERIFN